MRIAIALAAMALLVGCAPSLYQQGRQEAKQGRYEAAAQKFYDHIRVNPKSAEAWRELGVVFYDAGDFAKSEEALLQANNIAPDARTNLYLGMLYEKQSQYGKAVDAYRAALNLKPGSDVRDMIQGRLGQVLAMQLRQEASRAVAGEAAIKADTIPENTVAVVDFDNSHLPADLAPLSKGLAEFTAADLSKVKSLRVVDRMKIDYLLKELKLGASAYTDPASSPRLGRLLGSRRIITGTVVETGKEEFRMDGAVVSTADSAAKMTSPTEGTLERFFQVQKDFVFKVIDNLGVTLTSEERDSIQKVPTESYLAFMAYCRGLDYAGRGMPDQARAEFRQAVQADGKFAMAKQQVAVLSKAAPAGDATGGFEQFEAEVSKESSQDIAGTAVDQFQTGALDRTGFIKQLNRLDEYGNPSDTPPRTGEVVFRGIIIIQGDLDARP